MTEFPGVMLFTSYDHELTQTVANRVVELSKDGCVDRMMTYDKFIKAKAEGRNSGLKPVECSHRPFLKEKSRWGSTGHKSLGSQFTDVIGLNNFHFKK